MNTKSIKLTAASFGIAFTLTAGAVAGPKPDTMALSRYFGPEKQPVTIGLLVNGASPIVSERGVKPAQQVRTDSTVSYVPGPHGEKYVSRR